MLDSQRLGKIFWNNLFQMKILIRHLQLLFK